MTYAYRPGRIRAADCHLGDFVASLDVETDLAEYPHAARSDSGVLIYDADAIRSGIRDTGERTTISAELAHALLDGPGIVVFSGAFGTASRLADTTDLFFEMIAEQRAAGTNAGDHFAAPGANDRVWNALQKLALRDPELFAAYYADDILALISEAWLGPMYQVTSAINVVNPGGQAQQPHRDYHLGFMSPESAARFPAHTHRISPALTLQGAIAHVDMPVESGPTLYLPHSQRYSHGYLAFTLPEFRRYFDENHVQLPLKAGDAVFFNPALFHAAGTNRSTSVRRMANLLQVSSAFGRAMEAVDRSSMLRAVYPTLLVRYASGDVAGVRNVIAATAEGYAFPSNLDRDQPVSGMHGETQAELAWHAVVSGLDAAAFDAELTTLDERHRP